jgi:hypothetical protein
MKPRQIHHSLITPCLIYLSFFFIFPSFPFFFFFSHSLSKNEIKINSSHSLNSHLLHHQYKNGYENFRFSTSPLHPINTQTQMEINFSIFQLTIYPKTLEMEIKFSYFSMSFLFFHIIVAPLLLFGAGKENVRT